jgi:hypothetical protein
MKLKHLFYFLSIALLVQCGDAEDRSVGTEMIDIPTNEDGSVNEDELPVINFAEKTFQAGKITQGEIITHTFKFTNTGEAPLLIATVDGSCGCTIPRSYPTGKIMPGEGGEIEVEYNSDGKSGIQDVSIIVSANTVPAATQLMIKTEVVVPDNMK